MNKAHESVALKDGVVELFEDVQLDRERLQHLRALAPGNEASETGNGRPAVLSRRRWLTMAASLAAVGTLGLWASRRETYTGHIQMLADEVAYNHLVHGAAAGGKLDASGSTLDVLRPTFASIGFALQDATADTALTDATLLGGRFCSVMTAAAVQLRYTSPRGEVSVCQTRFDPMRHGDVPDLAVARGEPVVLHTRGVRVSLAHRAGVLIAVVA